jgi:hypothetical protein
MKQIGPDMVQDILEMKNQIRKNRKERRHKKEGVN